MGPGLRRRAGRLGRHFRLRRRNGRTRRSVAWPAGADPGSPAIPDGTHSRGRPPRAKGDGLRPARPRRSRSGPAGPNRPSASIRTPTVCVFLAASRASRIVLPSKTSPSGSPRTRMPGAPADRPLSSMMFRSRRLRCGDIPAASSRKSTPQAPLRTTWLLAEQVVRVLVPDRDAGLAVVLQAVALEHARGGRASRGTVRRSRCGGPGSRGPSAAASRCPGAGRGACCPRRRNRRPSRRWIAGS